MAKEWMKYSHQQLLQHGFVFQDNLYQRGGFLFNYHEACMAVYFKENPEQIPPRGQRRWNRKKSRRILVNGVLHKDMEVTQ